MAVIFKAGASDTGKASGPKIPDNFGEVWKKFRLNDELSKEDLIKIPRRFEFKNDFNRLGIEAISNLPGDSGFERLGKLFNNPDLFLVICPMIDKSSPEQVEKDVRRFLSGHPRFFLEQRDGKGRTPLMAAADKGYEGAVRALLEAGASVMARDTAGNNALERARGKGHDGIVRLMEQQVAADRQDLERVCREGIPAHKVLAPRGKWVWKKAGP